MQDDINPPYSFKKFFKTLTTYGSIILVALIFMSWLQTDRDSLSQLDFKALQKTHPQLNDEPVVLRFVATWCKICSFENDNVERANMLAAVNTINVVVGSSIEEGLAYLKKHNLDSKHSIIDSQGNLFRQFGGKAVPLTVFIGADQKVHHLTLGYTSTLGLIMRHWLSKL
jgi:hypothetical protein